MKKNILTVIRHGETYWNVEKKLQGQANSPLTKLGEKQAELLSKELKNEKFDLLISSDLPRCIHTTNEINRFHSLLMDLEPRIRERNFGILQGLTRDVIKEKHTDIYQRLCKGDLNFSAPQGEGLEDIYNRVSEFIDELAEKYENKNILIISHGGVLDCLMRKTMNIPLDAPRNFTIYNTSINKFSTSSNGLKLELWGDISHLKELKSIDDF